MKAYDTKKRLTVAQRKTVKDYVDKEFNKRKKQYEKGCNDRIFFLHYLALAIVLEEELHLNEEERCKVANACMLKVQEISDFCESNKCINGAEGREEYDCEYNLAKLEELANRYNVHWDESIFVYEEGEIDA